MPDFSTLSLTVGSAAICSAAASLNLLISFILVAAAIFFFVVKPMNAMEKRRQAGEAPATPTTKTCTECLSSIPLAAKRCAFCGQPHASSLANGCNR